MHIIHDLSSTNGTYLNGNRVSRPQPLRDGDRITMGNTEWLYHQRGDTASMPRR
jgi:pSer/pThr/pTyr-binding forkhead associated (FHA) protein